MNECFVSAGPMKHFGLALLLSLLYLHATIQVTVYATPMERAGFPFTRPPPRPYKNLPPRLQPHSVHSFEHIWAHHPREAPFPVQHDINPSRLVSGDVSNRYTGVSESFTNAESARAEGGANVQFGTLPTHSTLYGQADLQHTVGADHSHLKSSLYSLDPVEFFAKARVRHPEMTSMNFFDPVQNLEQPQQQTEKYVPSSPLIKILQREEGKRTSAEWPMSSTRVRKEELYNKKPSFIVQSAVHIGSSNPREMSSVAASKAISKQSNLHGQSSSSRRGKFSLPSTSTQKATTSKSPSISKLDISTWLRPATKKAVKANMLAPELSPVASSAFAALLDDDQTQDDMREQSSSTSEDENEHDDGRTGGERGGNFLDPLQTEKVRQRQQLKQLKGKGGYSRATQNKNIY